jgi:CHRD domain
VTLSEIRAVLGLGKTIGESDIKALLTIFEEGRTMTLRGFRRVFNATRDSFKPVKTIPTIMAAAIGIAGTAVAQTYDEVVARLSGFNEVHFDAGGQGTPPSAPALRGAISTTGSGKFRAIINENARTIDYELSYEALEGTVTQGHIHFGQRHTVGGIVVWLCQTSTNRSPVAITPECPQEGTVTGTITPDQVLAQNLQGFAAGDFDELVRAIRNGAAYANVHSTLFPPGEIRGHIRVRRDR